MESKYPIWAAWSKESILVYKKTTPAKFDEGLIPHQTSPGLRYQMRLYPMNNGSIILRSGDSANTYLDISKDGSSFQSDHRYSDAFATFPVYKVIPLKDGGVIGISGDELNQNLTFISPEGVVQKFSPPDHFVVHDIDRDINGSFWICGKTQAHNLKSIDFRQAVAFRNSGSQTWEIIKVAGGRLRVAWKTLISGALESYKTVGFVNEYLILSSETSDIDSPSTYIYVRSPNGKWKSDVLKHDTFRVALPLSDGGIRIVSHFGQSISIRNDKWNRENLIPLIRKVVEDFIDLSHYDIRYEIIDAQASEIGEALLVVSLRRIQDEQLVRYGEALISISEQESTLIHLQYNNGFS